MTAIIEDAKELKVNKWGTLNTIASPNKLPEGHSPRLNNVWTDERPGSVVTANGYILLGEIPSGNPPTFGIDFYKSADGTSQFVVSDGETVWWTTNYVDYTVIATGLAEFFQLRGAVIRDKLWLVNGNDPVMTWDGTTLSTLDGTGGTPDVPIGKFIKYHDERVWIYAIEGDLSSTRFTALTDASGTFIAPDHASAWPSDNELQISEGDSDVGTGLFIYRGSLYFSKQYSLWRLVGYDEYTYDRVKTRSSTGTRFQESIEEKDNLINFIGVDGMYEFDGEDSKRISDIIDPASAEEGTFAFRNLQQALLNNRFWNVSSTAEFETGTIPANMSSASEQLSLVPADDTETDFNQGTNDDTSTSLTPGSVQLAYQASGGTTVNAMLGGAASLPGGSTVVGVASSINDNNQSSACGYRQDVNGAIGVWQVFFNAAAYVGKVTIAKFYFERHDSPLSGTAKIQYSPNGTSWSDVPGGTVSLPASTSILTQAYRYYAFDPGGSHNFVNDVDLTVTFNSVRAYGIRLVTTINRGNVVIKELYAYKTPFELSGTFTSKAIDYGVAPATYGTIVADVTTNGESYQLFTQSSSDGLTWEAAVNAGGSFDVNIGSTLQRYLRWGVTFTSAAGLNTPVVSKVFVGATYLSEVHDTGGNVFAWAAFQMQQNKAGQTLNAYYRSAVLAADVLTEPWTAIVPGAVIAADTADVFIQIKFELSTTSTTNLPSVQDFTVNWILSSGAGVNTLQNVASVVWLNRYWLSAATLGADSNDVIIIQGKNTFEGPWMQKDWNILMFCRFQNILIGGSSTDGSLYRLDYGYSKAGDAMDSYFETADLSNDEFQMKGLEMLVTADRTGPYDLNVGWSTDSGETWTEKQMDLTRDDGASLSYTKQFNIFYLSDTVRFRVRINAADQPFSCDEILSYYRETPQRGTL